jgi:signal transduction histidine kinase
LIAPLDPALIERVIDNLVGNAFKYTEERTGRIQVSGCGEIAVQDAPGGGSDFVLRIPAR